VNDKTSQSNVRGQCPNCNANRKAEIVAEDIVEEDGIVYGKSTYSILRCLGCDARYFRLAEVCSEDASPEIDDETGEVTWEMDERVTYWPSMSKIWSRPSWLWLEFEFQYTDLAELLNELYSSLDHKLYTLATIGIRTVFDCASEILGVDSSQSFSEKLKELVAGNKIGGEEKEILSILADAGSAAAHRGWKPTEVEITDLMQALENFLQRSFVLKHKLRQIGKSIPHRNPKKI
jgi:hypothetical protein